MPNNEIIVANYKILVNGSELAKDLMAAVLGLTIEDEINLPAMFTIKLNIVDSEKGDWRGVDLKSFKLGDVIKISMGADDTVPMVIGEITSLDVTFGENSFMEIRGFDRMHRLRFGTQRRSFKDMKDSDIAQTIASQAGLSAQTDDTGTVQTYLFQNNQSNYEFLRERSERLGYEMLVNDKTFIFRKSQESKAPELTLKYNQDFDSFSVQMKTLTEGSKVEVRGWSVKDKKEITASASSGSETSTMSGQDSGYKLSKSAFGDSQVALVNEPVVDASDAEKLAKAKYNVNLKEFITGEGTMSGSPSIRAGKTVKIEGIGPRFSGVYYLISTTHSISDQGYITTFKVKRTGI